MYIRFALAAFIEFLVHCGPLTIDRIVLVSADSVPLGDNHLLQGTGVAEVGFRTRRLKTLLYWNTRRRSPT